MSIEGVSKNSWRILKLPQILKRFWCNMREQVFCIFLKPEYFISTDELANEDTYADYKL